jgi:predicted small lipoprotein YifL
MTRLILAAAIALSLSATGCGRKGAPSPPGPAADITYPHAYPSE